MSDITRLGFLGLGNMGAAIALRLVHPGSTLHVFDPSPEAVRPLVEAGAIAHASPRAVAEAATVVMACLPNSAVCESVLFGEDGVAAGKAVRTYIEMSTLGPTVVASNAKRLDAAKIASIDAPVSGGPAAAHAGTLSIMLSGNDDVVATTMPWLTLIAKKICRLGEQPGQAQAMKLVNNIMLAANMAVASEALTIGAKAGLDADAMIEVIRSSTGNSAAADILARFAICGAFDFGAHISIVAKDVELAIDEAKALDVPVPVLNEARSLWHDAIEQGLGGDDFTSILKIVEARGGATVRGAPRR
ncbi:3-hydroxyisobutyrate dehydrogenase [Caballeronia hypogeia]|uniref:3-hydroxyisobutyrate dehydrogenase n=1 Tax=Caballeronia hypogeia TaxID=1777140 RepID=A0A158A8X3_9BURK|nr:NAD(P)-dependent oxidoreductase [Caballeronia hypogeia]SAK53547.1 3-hydroxyisobutyrate dehydrogenase [Caballeronia hypogeia]